MKHFPKYILLLIFFISSNLAFCLKQNEVTSSLAPDITDLYLLQGLYSINKSENNYFHSVNFTYALSSRNDLVRSRFLHRLRLNLGLTNVLAELEYELGYRVGVSRYFYFMPYLAVGSNVYSAKYGGGIDFVISTKSRTFIIANINYLGNKELFGHTEAKQWYQSGFGVKIGVEYQLVILIQPGYCGSAYGNN